MNVRCLITRVTVFAFLLFTGLSHHAVAIQQDTSKSSKDDQATGRSAGDQKSSSNDDIQLPKLRDELASRVKVDQKARFEMLNLGGANSDEKAKAETEAKRADLIAKITEIDADNTKWLEEKISAHGWLGKDLVGPDGAHNAWLLVQHADRNPDFQKKCLALMEKMPKGQVAGVDIAYLTDRVLVADNKPQRYGTQCVVEEGKAKVKKLEDEENLNKRRADVGLPPIEQYLKMVEQMYAKNAKSNDEKE